MLHEVKYARKVTTAIFHRESMFEVTGHLAESFQCGTGLMGYNSPMEFHFKQYEAFISCFENLKTFQEI